MESTLWFDMLDEGCRWNGQDRPQKRKYLSFSANYKSLCTTFPQLWINEITDKEGKIFED